ncbi:hypothetical protein HUN01_16765 [Nostoc edaphicum CCNP1411]|uniref:Uncharacterized protein n=1 Tax=Nostoc edaphicum CCNP1411 TaxID=1472755 RepID=A0A7D7LDJ2_9NOSO|nr:hypothetical protein [Nostoc edaphicum]QMS89150.1 hypothetical protein HUN01_16765 [Nostoc edaphicum CCNP1411]
MQYSSDKTKTLVETAIYRVLKTHNFVLLALNRTVLRGIRLWQTRTVFVRIRDR